MGASSSNADQKRKSKARKGLPLPILPAAAIPGQTYLRADGTFVPATPVQAGCSAESGLPASLLGQLQGLTDKYTALGYLKVCPSDTPGSIFIYYKYNKGRWANHYIVVLGPLEQLEYLVQLLFDKNTEVEMGRRKPQYDAYPGRP